jgi:hypothetical protein
MHTVTRGASTLVLLTLVLGAGLARAETVNCTAITALPTVITVQGVYCLTGNLSTAMAFGRAIEIQANNVVLDLNGFRLAGLAAGPATGTIGIYGFNRQNLTIKNGTVRGFWVGIWLGTDGSVAGGHLVEDIHADRNTVGGIAVLGSGSLVRRNRVVATGGSTCCGPHISAFGLLGSGAGVRVLDNDVIDVVKQGSGLARGILFDVCPGCLAVSNRITNADRGIDYDTPALAYGKYRDNLTFGVTTPYTNGTDAGNNN